VDRRQKTKYCCIIALERFPKLPPKLSKAAEESRENPCFRLPHCRLTPPLQVTPSNIGTNLILAETRVIGLHLCIMTLQGHPRSLILALIESAYMTSYTTSILTLVLSCRVSEILQLLYAESRFFDTPPLVGQKFWGVPLGVDPSCWGCKERTSQTN